MGRRTGRKSLPREASCAAASRPEPTGASRRSSTGASRRAGTGAGGARRVDRRPGRNLARRLRERRDCVSTFGFETRRCAECGCSVSSLAGFGSVALCSYCGAGPDARHLVSVALADARALEPLERTVDVARPGRAGRSRESAPSTKQAAEPAASREHGGAGRDGPLTGEPLVGTRTLARYQAATPR